jgi:hypothetical protein
MTREEQKKLELIRALAAEGPHDIKMNFTVEPLSEQCRANLQRACDKFDLIWFTVCQFNLPISSISPPLER